MEALRFWSKRERKLTECLPPSVCHQEVGTKDGNTSKLKLFFLQYYQCISWYLVISYKSEWWYIDCKEIQYHATLAGTSSNWVNFTQAWKRAKGQAYPSYLRQGQLCIHIPTLSLTGAVFLLGLFWVVQHTWVVWYTIWMTMESNYAPLGSIAN